MKCNNNKTWHHSNKSIFNSFVATATFLETSSSYIYYPLFYFFFMIFFHMYSHLTGQQGNKKGDPHSSLSFQPVYKFESFTRQLLKIFPLSPLRKIGCNKPMFKLCLKVETLRWVQWIGLNSLKKMNYFK